MPGGILRPLLLTALLVTLGEAAESPNVQLPRYVGVETMRNNIPKSPAMISGWCIQKEVKQLHCSFVQIRFMQPQSDTQDLMVSVFRQTLTRASDTAQWVSREGPSGACGVVDVSILEPKPGQNVIPVLWGTYTSHQIYTNRAGPLCDKLPTEEKETFSWKNPPVIIGGKKINGMSVTFPDIP